MSLILDPAQGLFHTVFHELLSQAKQMGVPMRVAAVTTDPFTSRPLVILNDESGTRSVALCVGNPEAAAIAAELRGVGLERPNTHQLTYQLLERAGARVVRAVVTDVSSETFCAELELELSCGTRVRHEARASDAIAVALCADASIVVDDRVVAICAGAEPVAFLGPDADELRGMAVGDDLSGSWKM